MRVPKSPFEQLSSLLLAVQFQTKREIKQRKRREKGGQFFRFDGGELLAGRREKEILDSFSIWWSRRI
jgi:hypothetical protein